MSSTVTVEYGTEISKTVVSELGPSKEENMSRWEVAVENETDGGGFRRIRGDLDMEVEKG